MFNNETPSFFGLKPNENKIKMVKKKQKKTAYYIAVKVKRAMSSWREIHGLDNYHTPQSFTFQSVPAS